VQAGGRVSCLLLLLLQGACLSLCVYVCVYVCVSMGVSGQEGGLCIMLGG
jgi:hypothetical protein